MTALASVSMRKRQDLDRFDDLLMLTGIKIWNGAMVAKDPLTGYATNAENSANMWVSGVAEETKDNTGGASGDEKINISFDRIFEFATTGATKDKEGDIVYVVDNNTVSFTDPGNTVIAGYCHRYINSTSIFVYIPGVKKQYGLTNTLKESSIPLTSFMDTSKETLTATPAAGNFNRASFTNGLQIEGEATQNTTNTDVTYVEFMLPENYVDGAPLTVRIRLKVAGTGTLGACKIDAEFFTIADGTASSDLCTTSEQLTTSGAAYYDFVITPTTLVKNAHCILKMTAVTVETANVNTLTSTIYSTKLRYNNA